MLLKLMTKINLICARLKATSRYTLTNFVLKVSFMPSYYSLNDLMWQDGLLVDFLQKKVVDKWVRSFLVYSSYLLSERVLFEFVVKFYIDFVMWPTVQSSPFEFTNMSLTLTALIAAIASTILLFNLNYLWVMCL